MAKKWLTAPIIMALLRTLFWIAAKGNFAVGMSHIPGTDNGVADALSRFQVKRFRRLAPSARHSPTPVPKAALDL